MRSGFKCDISPVENKMLEDIEEYDSVAFHDALLAMSFLFCGACPLNGISTDIESRAHMVVTTRGASGSLLMRREGNRHSVKPSRADYNLMEKDGSPNSTLDSVTENLLRVAPVAIKQFYFSRISPHGYSTHEKVEEVFEVTRYEGLSVLIILLSLSFIVWLVLYID